MKLVEDYFKEGKNNIVWLDNDFKKYFYGMELKKGKGKLKYRQTEKEMTFQEMKDEFNADFVELGDIDLKNKDLLQNGYANFWFVKDRNGNCFAVGANRYSVGWNVGVRRFENSRRWFVGNHVSFRNSLKLETSGDLETRVLELEKDMQKIKKFLII